MNTIIHDIWEKALIDIESEVGSGVFNLWFKPMKLKSFEDFVVNIEIPNRFFKEWIEDFYPTIIERVLGRLLNKPIKVEYIIDKKEDSKLKVSITALENRRKWLASRGIFLNPKYTFETFVVGNSNQLANAAARKVAENPGLSYNPLFIYGGVGLGKTHLINAIGNSILDRNSTTALCYLSSEQFINEVVTALRNDRMTEFKEKYRNLEVLLIDDIQFIANKPATQEEFFHTFNALYERQKQIVISSDRPPADIPDITDRLRSRFNMGLIVDIQVPEVETKVAIIFKKAEKEGILIPEDVAYFLATKIKSNIRDIEGCLIKLGAYSSLTNIPISLEMAKNVLKGQIEDNDKPITFDLIQKTVADYFGIKLQDLKSKRRTKDLVIARQIAMFLCRQYTEMSLSEIGNAFGGKEHATVIYAFKQVEEKLISDEKLFKNVENIKKRLNIS
ncbi:MAG: chromosomal replication initiator protein DnaA [Thermodesulfovibrionales bacterium]|nr:chromosomal replication initiator protein DnaA [Thermodesulfovibrionales bacterium]